MCAPVLDNLTANGTIFGATSTPTNSLFTKLGVRGSTPSLTGSAITLDNGKPVTGRSRLLEDFRYFYFLYVELLIN